MKRLFLIIILLVLTISLTYGQGPFRVIFSFGNNYEKNPKGFYELKNGTLLHADDEIIVMPNGLVILMDNEGRLLELELEGRYTTSMLDLTNLSSPSELIYQEWEAYYNPKRLLDEPLLGGEQNQETLRFDFPASTAVYGSKIQLNWPDLNEQYIITMSDEYDDIIQRIVIDQPEFNINLLSQNLAFKDFIGVGVVTKNSRKWIGFAVLDKLSPPDKELLDQLLRVFPAENDIIIGLTKAIIFSNRGLYADASSLLRVLNKSNEGRLESFYKDYLRLNGFD